MVYQSGKDDCGKAVVRNMAVLVFGEDDFQILPLREACRDFLSIRRALQNIGIQCIPYAIESLDFVRKEQLPGIAQIKMGTRRILSSLGKSAEKSLSTIRNLALIRLRGTNSSMFLWERCS